MRGCVCRCMKGNVKTSIVVIATVTALVGGICIGALTERRDRAAVSRGAGYGDSKLEAIWKLVDKHYVDPLGGDSVMDRVYAAVLSTLDPHSVYLSKSLLARENEELRGNFEGVGIMIRMLEDTVSVIQVIEGGPSERAGVLAGDRILSVDGVPVTGVKMPSDSVVMRLRGRRRSVADLLVWREREGRTVTLKVKRDVIGTPTVVYSGMLDARTGYVRLERFGEHTYDEFCQAVRDLKGRGMKRMVLDLRGNGGGLLSAAIGICDELLGGKEMIVYTDGAHERRKEEHSTPGGLFAEGDLVVMIDEFSASASEIVSGAVQDNDRGLVVGRRSFGKGLVQQQFPLPDGSAVQLTIARYYTPSGRCIQRPYDDGTEQYYNDFVRQVWNEYEGDSLVAGGDTTPYYTAKGRVVYGGGGITPDRSIGYAKDTNVGYYNQLLSRGVIGDCVFHYVAREGGALRERYADVEHFVKDYAVSDKLLNSVIEAGERKGVARDAKSLSHWQSDIKARIKAEMGNMLFSTSAFYAVMVPFDRELKEATGYLGK